jgi:hypothetical protein
VNVTPLLANAATVTTTGPVVAPVGTGAAMLVVLQVVGVVKMPLNVTLLVPWVAPKFTPRIVTEMPTGPEIGESPLMPGATVKVTPLLVAAPTVTATGPVLAPLGTGTTMLVLLQLVGLAATPLNLTLLAP